jgi:hypothetical protein
MTKAEEEGAADRELLAPRLRAYSFALMGS